MSATIDSTANASSAIAPTSLRIRGSTAETAPRCGWRRRAELMPGGSRGAQPPGGSSYLHDHRQHHRPALRALVEVGRDAVVDRVAQRRDLREVLARLRLAEPVEDALLGALDDVRRVLLGHEALRDDVRARQDLARLPLDREHDEEDAVAADRPAIAHHRLADVADAEAVDIHNARGDLLAETSASLVDLERVAVGDHERVPRRDAEVDRDARVAHEHPVLAVDRNEVLRSQDVEEQLELLLARVPGDVGPNARVVDDLRTQLEEVVDGAADELFVAGDGRRRHDDGVAVLHRDVPVVAEGHA